MAANKELQDLFQVTYFTPAEQKQFLMKVRKELDSRGITLDSLR
jgi:hypothetical protein